MGQNERWRQTHVSMNIICFIHLHPSSTCIKSWEHVRECAVLWVSTIGTCIYGDEWEVLEVQVARFDVCLLDPGPGLTVTRTVRYVRSAVP